MIPTLVASHTSRAPTRVRGFTLIELLVALAAMALMAGLSWRGLDGMVRAQSQIQQRADAVLTLQAGLTQWAADLDALLQLPQIQTLDWDGRGLRIIRRSTVKPGDGVLVVVRTRAGEVRIPRAAVARAKRVPPAPERRRPRAGEGTAPGTGTASGTGSVSGG